jgi:hypothetical protein
MRSCWAHVLPGARTPAMTTDRRDIIREAIRDKHIIVVAAAGQYAFTSTENSTVEPASYPGVVAASGCTDIGHPWDLAGNTRPSGHCQQQRVPRNT